MVDNISKVNNNEARGENVYKSETSATLDESNKTDRTSNAVN